MANEIITLIEYITTSPWFIGAIIGVAIAELFVIGLSIFTIYKIFHRRKK